MLEMDSMILWIFKFMDNSIVSLAQYYECLAQYCDALFDENGDNGHQLSFENNLPQRATPTCLQQLVLVLQLQLLLLLYR